MEKKISDSDKKLAELYVSILKTYKNYNDVMIMIYGNQADHYRKLAQDLTFKEPFKLFKKSHMQWENTLDDLYKREFECYTKINELMTEYDDVLKLHKI